MDVIKIEPKLFMNIFLHTIGMKPADVHLSTLQEKVWIHAKYPNYFSYNPSRFYGYHGLKDFDFIIHRRENDIIICNLKIEGMRFPRADGLLLVPADAYFTVMKKFAMMMLGRDKFGIRMNKQCQPTYRADGDFLICEIAYNGNIGISPSIADNSREFCKRFGIEFMEFLSQEYGRPILILRRAGRIPSDNNKN